MPDLSEKRSALLTDLHKRKGCQHGNRFDEHCRDCDIVWHRHMLAVAQRNVDWHRAALAEMGEQQ